MFNASKPDLRFNFPGLRENFFQEFNSMCDNVWNHTVIEYGPVSCSTKLEHPKYNLYYRKPVDSPATREIVLDVFLPYVKKDNIDLEFDESKNELTVHVANHQDNSIKEKDWVVRQIPRGSFHQKFTLQKGYPVKDAKADFAEGILSITIPFVLTPGNQPNTKRIKIR